MSMIICTLFFKTFFPVLFFVESNETYRTLSEENIKLQAEIMQYKVIKGNIPF